LKITTKIYSPELRPDLQTKESIANFLFTSLEQYGDPIDQIMKCIEYATTQTNSFGGFIVVAHYEDKIVGAVIVNQTGMKGYIPENILVYIATDSSYRGMGIGKKLMKEAIEKSEGNIALHVEANNPAKILYEKLGFTNKYLEMRLIKE
jgi:ribosomal protein S18 acetylase RimI-like enzyme